MRKIGILKFFIFKNTYWKLKLRYLIREFYSTTKKFDIKSKNRKKIMFRTKNNSVLLGI